MLNFVTSIDQNALFSHCVPVVLITQEVSLFPQTSFYTIDSQGCGIYNPTPSEPAFSMS